MFQPEQWPAYEVSRARRLAMTLTEQCVCVLVRQRCSGGKEFACYSFGCCFVRLTCFPLLFSLTLGSDLGIPPAAAAAAAADPAALVASGTANGETSPDASAQVKRKPGRPRKHPLPTSSDTTATGGIPSVTVLATEPKAKPAPPAVRPPSAVPQVTTFAALAARLGLPGWHPPPPLGVPPTCPAPLFSSSYPGMITCPASGPPSLFASPNAPLLPASAGASSHLLTGSHCVLPHISTNCTSFPALLPSQAQHPLPPSSPHISSHPMSSHTATATPLLHPAVPLAGIDGCITSHSQQQQRANGMLTYPLLAGPTASSDPRALLSCHAVETLPGCPAQHSSEHMLSQQQSADASPACKKGKVGPGFRTNVSGTHVRLLLQSPFSCF
jgi:hypothetical protein